MDDIPQQTWYENIDTYNRQIRLVHLMPGYHNSAIHCELVTANLDQYPHPRYEALSYEWGEGGRSASLLGPSIIIDGHQFKVRDNLFLALQHLRIIEGTRV